MKPAIAVLVLLVMVTVTPASARQPAAGPGGTPRQTPAPRLRGVRFVGDPALEPDALKRELEALRVRRVIPGIWTRRPRYDSRAVEADLARLRSFYFSHGYFDARVEARGLIFDHGGAILTFDVESGPKYGVRHVDVDGITGEHQAKRIVSTGEFPADTLCTCLLEARRTAESHGRIDFAAELEVSPADAPASSDTGRAWVDVTARVRPGSPYAVGRIDFSGHRRVNESTLRRALTLQERSLLDVGKLRASLARLNRLGLFDPLTLEDVGIERHPETLSADLTLALTERRARSWSLSGPLGPAGLGRLETRISSRLPPWGRGIFEASTYSVTLSLAGFSNPLIRLLPIREWASTPALLVLERPYLPGQALFSGFTLSPQLSARQTLAGFGLTHLDRAAEAAFVGGPADSSSLVIPISGGEASGVGRASEKPGFLICKPPAPPHERLRRVALTAADLTIPVFRPF